MNAAISISQAGAPEIGSGKLAALDHSATEAGRAKIAPAQRSAPKIDSIEHRAGEVTAFEASSGETATRLKTAGAHIRRDHAGIAQVSVRKPCSAEIGIRKLAEPEGRLTDTGGCEDQPGTLRSIEINPRQLTTLEITVLKTRAEKRDQPKSSITKAQAGRANIGKKNRVEITLGKIHIVEKLRGAEIQVPQDRVPNTGRPEACPGQACALKLCLREIGIFKHRPRQGGVRQPNAVKTRSDKDTLVQLGVTQIAAIKNTALESAGLERRLHEIAR